MSIDFDQLDKLLELIDQHIDVEHCQRVDERYRRSLSYEDIDSPPLVFQPEFGNIWKLPKPWDKFDRYSYRQGFECPAAMMQNMLLDRVVPGLVLKDDNPLAIRNDHGTIQIASILGGNWEMHQNNYPWVKSVGSLEAIRAIIDEDLDIEGGGVLPQSLETLKFYNEKLSSYPNCKKAIQISLPDLQGPMDTADILWGTEIFIMMLQEPELVTALMGKIVRTMLTALDYYRQFTFDRLDPLANTQHWYNIPGRIMIRNDSSIMVSPDMYRQIIAPQDAKLLREVGSGSIHFCGNGQHLIEPMLEISDLRGLDFGQAEMMDMEKNYEKAKMHKVALTCLKPSKDDLISGQAMRQFPTGVVLVYNAKTLEEAIDIRKRLP